MSQVSQLSQLFHRVSPQQPKITLHHARYLQAIARAPVPALEPRSCVIGDPSQRQVVIKKQEHETPEEQRTRNRIVYNDRGNQMSNHI